MKHTLPDLILPAVDRFKTASLSFGCSNQRRFARRHLEVGLFSLLAVVLVLSLKPEPSYIGLNPVFDPPEGVYEGDIVIRIKVPSPDIKIIFTVDGSTPTLEYALLYSNPLKLVSTPESVIVIRARALYPDGEMGPVVSASYFCGVETELAIMSLIIEPDDFWGVEEGIYANPSKRGLDWERPADVLYLKTGEEGQPNPIAFHVPAGIRIHGGTTRLNVPKKSLRLYWRKEYGLAWLEYPLFDNETAENEHLSQQDNEETAFKRLVVHDGGQDYTARNWTLIRTPLMNILANQIGIYSTMSKPVLLYINGQCQGIYQLRERIDDWYFTEYLGLTAVDFLDAPFLPSVNRDGRHWENLLQFLESNNLVDPENYEYIKSQIDVNSYVDYAILQLYAVNNDWLNHNVKQFRTRTQGGRWNWILWDVDYGFGKEWQSFYEFDMIEWLYSEPGENFERGSLLLRKLLENPDFQELFLSRTSDLLNTTLHPDRVEALVETLADELRADIHYEVERWPRKGDWEESVEEIREFVRCRPDAFRQNLINGFGLAGTDAILFKSTGQGRAAVNGMLLPKEAWKGIYFKGLEVEVTAAPEPGYRFDRWQIVAMASGDLVHVPDTPQLVITITESLEITPVFEPVQENDTRPGDVVIKQVDVGNLDDSKVDWFELLVMRPGGVDMRGWRVTDNDTKTSSDEGSLIFASEPVFSRIPFKTSIFVVLPGPLVDRENLPADNLFPLNGKMVLYVGNGHLEECVDPGFTLGRGDNLTLLAPGPTPAFEDDLGIAFVSIGSQQQPAVNAGSFGILSDGVVDGIPHAVP